MTEKRECSESWNRETCHTRKVGPGHGDSKTRHRSAVAQTAGAPGWGRAWRAELQPQRPGFLVEGERDPRKSLNQGVNHLMSMLKGPERLTGHAHRADEQRALRSSYRSAPEGPWVATWENEGQGKIHLCRETTRPSYEKRGDPRGQVPGTRRTV